MKNECFILLLVASLFGACSPTRQLISPETFTYSCPEILDMFPTDSLSVTELARDSLLAARYSVSSLHTANAFGFIRDLREFEKARMYLQQLGHSDSILIAYIGYGNRVEEGTNLADLEVKSVNDHIECTIQELEKFRTQLFVANTKIQNKLSNGAVLTGATTTILTAGILVSQDEDLIGSTFFDWVAVAGGIATVGLALRSSNIDKKISIHSPKNYIRAIWEGDNSEAVFPRSTWYLLNENLFYGNEPTSIRQEIINSWNGSANVLGNKENREYFPILLQSEGVHNQEMIDLRIDMLESIAVGVDEITRSLYLLNAERY